MASKKELHFFPGEHKLVWVIDGAADIKADAWGGEEPVPGVKYDVMKPRPTTPGRYVIHSYAPYHTKTWALSKLTWGTPLKVDSTGKSLLYQTGVASGAWARLEDKIPGATLEAIKNLYFTYYGSKNTYDMDGDGVPESWVFNDFGPWAVRYYKDKNANHKLDAGESLSGEMFHTTPDNEAQAALGKPIDLAPSHGCIHLVPAQREVLHKAGAFAKGNDVVIHKYTEKVPALWK